MERSKPKPPSLPPMPTGGQLDILAVLWRLGPSTVREVHEALGSDSGYTGTLKQMQAFYPEIQIQKVTNGLDRQLSLFTGANPSRH